MLRPFRLGYSWVVASPQSHLRFTKHYLHPITQLAIQAFPQALNMIRFDSDQPRVIRHVQDIPSTELARMLLRVSRVNPARPPLNSGILVILTFLRDRYEQWRDDQVNCCDFFPDVLLLLQSKARRNEFQRFLTQRFGTKGWEQATDLLIAAAWHAFQTARDRK